MIASLVVSWMLLLPAPYQGWTENLHMPLPSGPVRVVDAECPFFENAEGCAKGRTIWSPAENGRGVFTHELGHVFDSTMLSNRERRRFSRVIGWSGSWRPSIPFWLRPSELLAETWSRCALGDLRPIRTYGMEFPLQCGLVAGFAARQPVGGLKKAKTQTRRNK